MDQTGKKVPLANFRAENTLYMGVLPDGNETTKGVDGASMEKLLMGKTGSLPD